MLGIHERYPHIGRGLHTHRRRPNVLPRSAPPARRARSAHRRLVGSPQQHTRNHPSKNLHFSTEIRRIPVLEPHDQRFRTPRFASHRSRIARGLRSHQQRSLSAAAVPSSTWRHVPSLVAWSWSAPVGLVCQHILHDYAAPYSISNARRRAPQRRSFQRPSVTRGA